MFDDWLDDVVHHHGQTLLRFHAVLALVSRTGPLGTEVYRAVRGHLEHDPDPRRNSQPAEAGPINRLALMGRGLDLVELSPLSPAASWPDEWPFSIHARWHHSNGGTTWVSG